MSTGNIIKLNIGGTVFQTTKSTLTRFDGFFKTMLETDIPLEKDETGAIFVDRDPKYFRLILNFMRDGDVELPDCKKDREEIMKEAQYYLLDDLMKLFDSKKKPAVIQCNNHFLENHDQLVNAFERCTKKGTIVVTQSTEKSIYAAVKKFLIIDKYDKDFDVYFITDLSNFERSFEDWDVEIFDRSTKRILSTWVCKLDGVIKDINTVNH